MKNNVKHYYLYFFALIFSVMLYFSFSTLRFNGEVLKSVEGSGTATAGFKVATYLLWFIVLVFVLYANHLFIRRRSKEIGMYQLIGMTRGLVFRLLAFENILLIGCAILLGVMGGFLGSRLFALLLLKVIGVKAIVGITFSVQALLNTLAVFGITLAVILIQLFLFIYRRTLIQMLHAENATDASIKKLNVLHMVLGLVGFVCIIYGYYMSQTLFDGLGTELVRRMLIVLFITILGTFLVFRYFVALLINVWRTSKNGHVTSTGVVAFLPIMHRMKSNAKSLTLISVLTAVSLGINTLAYISYYSIEQEAMNELPTDFVVINDRADAFAKLLDEQGISFTRNDLHYLEANIDFPALLNNRDDVNTAGYYFNPSANIISANDIGVELTGNEAVIYGFNGYSSNIIKVKDEGLMEIEGFDGTIVHVKEINRSSIMQTYGTAATYLTVVVSDALFESLYVHENNFIYGTESYFDLVEAKDELAARALYEQSKANMDQGLNYVFLSQAAFIEEQKNILGFLIFVTAFLGIAFLIASGSILYFKQMSEADAERGSYTILRKIGYSQSDLLKGVVKKQLFNYGVIIIVGLCHSYFAVKSGWWFFGTAFWVPMITMMVLYVCIYIIFMCLTILYYKKTINDAL